MRKYTLSFADSISHKPDHPERTARQSIGWDVTYQIWPSRASMLATIHMQEKRAHRSSDWRECISEFLPGFLERNFFIAKLKKLN